MHISNTDTFKTHTQVFNSLFMHVSRNDIKSKFTLKYTSNYLTILAYCIVKPIEMYV